MLGKLKIIEYGSGGGDARLERLDAETLERLGAELFAQFVVVEIRREDPVVETVGVVSVPESLVEALVAAALVNHLLGREARHELVDIVVVTLCHVELSGRDVEKRHARGLVAEEYRCQKRIFLVGQDIVSEHHARCYEFYDAALDQTFDRLGILQLLADGYALARPDELGQIDVDGVVRESGKFDIRGGTVGAPRERDAQNRTRGYGILAECLVEVTYAEEQYCVGMHGLDLVILFHQGCLDVFSFSSHIRFVILQR